MQSLNFRFIVNAPADFVFEITNCLERWPKINPTCKYIEILEREGYKTSFRYTSMDNNSWISDHFAVPEERISYTQRRDPDPPIITLQFIRTFYVIDAKTTDVTEDIVYDHLLAEEQTNQISGRLRGHASRVQPVLKAYIEKCYSLQRKEGTS